MNRWERVQVLFEEAVQLDPAHQAHLLRERAQGDAELVRSVEALLEEDSRPLVRIERSASGVLEELRNTEPDPEQLCGETFGSYHVVEHIASGGMAHVYRALRTSAGTERRVALKVLRSGLSTDVLLERFQRERQTLARLEHEHIVSFLDAGALPDGRPFLAMEYVEGRSLTAWREGTTLRAQLELFRRVLGAVQYAHQQLVVHRDLKPSNVLVTAQGAPKVLDFGIAGALETHDVAGGPAPLTPRYASPEQLRGEAVTAASDVFSLGLVLHELVTGRLPETDADGTVVSAAGDLGAILARALAYEPTARYGTADQLAADLQRFLTSEPVSARPPTRAYRARLFARRHRWPLALVTAAVLACVAGWIGSDLDRRRAEREASTGWGAHAQARLTAHVFEDWISTVAGADAELSSSAAAHLETVLAAGLDRAPETETLVRLALAELLAEQGELRRAAQHAERASGLAQATRGIGPRERERAAALLERIERELAEPPRDTAQ